MDSSRPYKWDERIETVVTQRYEKWRSRQRDEKYTDRVAWWLKCAQKRKAIRDAVLREEETERLKTIVKEALRDEEGNRRAIAAENAQRYLDKHRYRGY
jgi:hypothetical protein